ncbi:MAG TPA: hypothetical protein VNZ67_02615, partial [bacterium]|nr:hypothetical protein [bacterium]
TLMELAGSEADGEMAILSAFMVFLRELIVAEDWGRFRATCRANNVGFDELKPLIEGIAEAIAGRPTPRPSDLPPGPGPTGARSRVVSLSPATGPRSA